MTISFNRYIDITSGVGAATTVPGRNFCARLFTTNPLLPTQSFIQFNDPADVGTYFGTSSVEYLRAVFYFAWVSKNITSPDTLQFARWVDADVAPLIYGAKLTETLGGFQAITTGSFSLTLGGVTNDFTNIDFSAATSLADVATILETVIQTGVGSLWTAATVTYDNTRGGFDFVGGATGVANVIVLEGMAGVPVAGLIGWLTGAILSNGDATETITQTLQNSYNASNNFGSFTFIPTLDQAQIVEAATWNYALNVVLMYSVRVNAGNAAAISAALAGLGGVGMTLAPLSGEYPEQAPMMILDATDYTSNNAVQNYMFQIFNLTPSVTSDTDANTYDALSVNYYGVTQTAGQQIAFYQRGELTGPATSPQDMNVYANEMWLKDAAGAALMTLLLSVARISANNQGVAQILSVLQAVINQGLANGTISVGKTLTITQQLYITEISGDANAWYQVQNIGYWINCKIVPTVVLNGNTEFQAVYTLIYSKDDVIRKVVGTQILI